MSILKYCLLHIRLLTTCDPVKKKDLTSKCFAETLIRCQHRHLFLVKKNIPRYYIYHKVSNLSFVKKSMSSWFSRFFQLDGRQHGGMAYIIWNYDNLSTKWYIKHLHVPLLNLNNTTDLFLRVTYQLSSINQETGMLLLRSERKKKKSCNKNSIKNTENSKFVNFLYNLWIFPWSIPTGLKVL